MSDLESATVRTLNRRLIPFLSALYIVSFLDRVNVGFAALQMNRDLGLSPAVYGFGAGIFFLGYAFCEVPSNLILARVGARRWIGRIMITWGVISAAMMFVRGPLSLYFLRFVLGIAEAGFFPGIIFYLGQWFPADARARSIARFMMAVPLAGVIGGPLSGALLGLDGQLGLAGWQWLFALEGLPAVVLGLVVLRFLPERPDEARWLTGEQRSWLTDRLEADRRRTGAHHRVDVGAALTSGIVWKMGLMVFLSNSFGQYALTLWLPQIVRGVSGLSNLQVGFVSAIPSLVGAVAMVAVAAHSDRTGERYLHITGAAAAASVGFLGSALAGSPVVAVGFLSVAEAGLLCVHPPFWPLPSKFLTGAAAAGGIGLINSLAVLSGLIGPYAVGLLNGARGDFRTGLLLLSVAPLSGAMLALRLRQDAALTARPDHMP